MSDVTLTMSIPAKKARRVLDVIDSPVNPRKSSRYPKSDILHWEHRVSRNVNPHDGRATHHWSCFFQFNRKRMHLSLGTPARSEAAHLARELYIFLRENGWEATLRKYRPWGKAIAAVTKGRIA